LENKKLVENMNEVLLTAEYVISMDEAGNIYSPGFILIKDNKISRIGKIGDLGEISSEVKIINLEKKVLMPGLVNAHAHTPMVLFRGRAEGISLFTMDGFLNTLRVLENAADEEMVPAAVEVSCAEMIRTGTTTFADQYFYMDKIAPVVDKSGLRAALAYGIVELGVDATRKREISLVTEFLDKYKGHPRIKPWVGPHAFFVDNSVEIIREEIRLATEYKTGFHIHFATNSEEDDYCQENFGMSAVQKMKELGVLDHRMLAAHCISVAESDYSILANAPFTAVMCPSAAMRSGTGAPNLVAMINAGVNVAIGSDNVVNSNSHDMFNQMQMLANLNSYKERTPAAIPAKQIVEIATMGGAIALGLEDEIGSLEIGKKADIISLDLSEIGWDPIASQDLYTALVYSISGYHVRDVMVDGKWLMRDSKWETLDFVKAQNQLDKDYQRLKNNLNS
jgi:5-methylthioadenosine/S-adenosylhomocysteine deaminase